MKTTKAIVMVIIALSLTIAFVGPSTSADQVLSDLKQRSEQGDKSAQFELGTKYLIGKDVKRDYEEALKWYRKAPEQGHSAALNEIGWMYQNGLGVQWRYDKGNGAHASTETYLILWVP